MTNELDCIVQDFLVESHENLDQLDQALVALEQGDRPRERLASIFRAVHTIKGTCGFLGFPHLERLSHAGESLLSRMRDGNILPTPETTNALLQLLDSIRDILASIETNGVEGDPAHQELIDTLERLQHTDTYPSPSSRDDCDGFATSIEKPLGGGPSASQSISDNAVRVDVKLLDKLMVFVGELVLVRNRMQQHANSLGNSPLTNSAQRLNLITTELQEAVMKTRMQPIGNIWSKFPRLIRDLSLSCGKQVQLQMDGLETELDKGLIEATKDPFTHLLRNAIDHGIETPEVRMARDKPAAGQIWCRAYHQGGQVHIEVIDDGEGICADRVKRKAIQQDLITQDQANQMSDRDAIRLIFSPGFSTAEQVTRVSGRGVGMDVVKANIERIGGTIDISSQPGAGTTVHITIPLTLAIIPALIIGRQEARFAVPQANLLELVRLDGDSVRQAIEFVHGAAVYRLRGQLLPLVHLNRALELENPEPINEYYSASAADSAPFNILVLQAENRRFGLVVDDIFDTAEIVVKPLDKRLHAIRAFSGATILGDGKLALILDVLSIGKTAGLLKGSQSHDSEAVQPYSSTAKIASHVRSSSGARAEQEAKFPRTGTIRLVVFEAAQNRCVAMPLSAVARLEEIPWKDFERVGDEWFVQYRGEILPLIDLRQEYSECPTTSFLGPVNNDSSSVAPVIVCEVDGKSCGFVVKRIVDIVDRQLEIQSQEVRPGVDGIAVVNDRVTEIIGAPTLLQRITARIGPTELNDARR